MGATGMQQFPLSAIGNLGYQNDDISVGVLP